MTLVSAQSPPPPDLMASGKRSAELEVLWVFGWLEMLQRQMAKGRGGVAWAALASLHRTPAAGLAWAPQS